MEQHQNNDSRLDWYVHAINDIPLELILKNGLSSNWYVHELNDITMELKPQKACTRSK